MHLAARIAFLFALQLFFCANITAQEPPLSAKLLDGSLSEIKDKQNVYLIVTRNLVVDSRDPARPILEAAYKKAPTGGRIYLLAYNTIARKLNDYINKHQSATAVYRPASADYIILFNLVRVRVFDRALYPQGEMYVIKNERAEGKQPRIIWRQHKDIMWAEDAVKSLIKDLKTIRGEN
jgi:hypothetical protein